MYELPEGETTDIDWERIETRLQDKETQKKIDEIVESFLKILNERRT